VKILSTLPFLLTFFVAPLAFSECAPEDSLCIHCTESIDKGRGGWIVPLIVHLEPGQTVVERWDFTECWFGIQNFTLYVQHEKRVKDSAFTVTATNLTTGEVSLGDTNIKYFQYADCSVIELTVTYSAAAKRSTDVQIQYTAAFGNPPLCQ
jgi:hypothetical protein